MQRIVLRRTTFFPPSPRTTRRRVNELLFPPKEAPKDMTRSPLCYACDLSLKNESGVHGRVNDTDWSVASLPYLTNITPEIGQTTIGTRPTTTGENPPRKKEPRRWSRSTKNAFTLQGEQARRLASEEWIEPQCNSLTHMATKSLTEPGGRRPFTYTLIETPHFRNNHSVALYQIQFTRRRCY